MSSVSRHASWLSLRSLEMDLPPDAVYASSALRAETRACWHSVQSSHAVFTLLNLACCRPDFQHCLCIALSWSTEELDTLAPPPWASFTAWTKRAAPMDPEKIGVRRWCEGRGCWWGGCSTEETRDARGARRPLPAGVDCFLDVQLHRGGRNTRPCAGSLSTTSLC